MGLSWTDANTADGIYVEAAFSRQVGTFFVAAVHNIPPRIPLDSPDWKKVTRNSLASILIVDGPAMGEVRASLHFRFSLNPRTENQNPVAIDPPRYAVRFQKKGGAGEGKNAASIRPTKYQKISETTGYSAT